ncbi:MAG: ABC transporter substrate-binding protein [Solirubrobacteraceae bacterium]
MTDPGMHDASGLTRRRLIEFGAQGAIGLTAGGWLAGCGGAKQKLSSTATPAATPKRGGELVMSMITGGSTETLVPGLAVSEPDIARAELLFDPLFRLDPDLGAAAAVAESAEPNADGTVWTVKIRDGVVWHDGKPVTADDVVYSINSWADKKQNYTAATIARVVDVKGVRKRDARTVEVPMRLPVGDFPILTAFYGFAVLPNGATPKEILKNPVGTGPWKFKSFKPGARSVFTANKDYWVHDGPYLDQLTVDSSFTEEPARLNSLLSGQSQVMQAMPFALARREKTARQIKLLEATGTSFQCFAMRTDKGPLADKRVRQALRLLADRKAFVDQILNGFGEAGDDLPSRGAKYYAEDLKREQDIDQAKSLLKAAGQEHLTVRLDTSNVLDGLVDASTLYQQQAKQAGVNVKINRIDPGTYFSVTPGRWLSYPFSTTFWVNGTASLSLFYLNALSKAAPYNETGWKDPAADKLLMEAIGTVDEKQAQDKWHEVQQLQFDEGGYLVYANQAYVDGLAKEVNGLEPSKAAWLSGFGLHNAWLA